MSVYHITAKGEPEICTAKIQCRLGGEQNHYTSKDKARQAFELSQQSEAFKKISKNDKLAKNQNDTASTVKESKNPVENNENSDYLSGSPNSSILKRVFERGEGVGKHQSFYSLHAGKMNPSNGDGDEYDHYGNGMTYILGEKDGKRARVVTSYYDDIDEARKSLGTSITQIKQRHTGYDAETRGLYILGVTNGKGDEYGWIPNKKVNYFVMK